MSRKLSLIPIGVIIVAGAAWASSLLFPDTVTFPRFPGGAGTLSGALSLFDPITGSARDTQKLGGTGSLGYLKGSVCPNPYEVWRGIDASGNAICGKNLPILSIGTFYELAPGCAEVMKRGTTTWIAGDTVTPLQSGDVVKTKNQVECEFTSIRFVADDSILRLDKNTIVELQTGELDGNTIAQAILQDGSLWGRVLTSTGVNIGGGGLIAGVRGTSVNVEKNLINNRLNILDSRRVDAGSLLRTSDAGNTITETASTGRTWELSATSQYSVVNPKWMAMKTSHWIRENMKRDIGYLRSLPQEGNVPAELLAATPTGAEKNTICIDYDGNGTDGRWWSNEVGCKPKNIIAFADYTKSTNLTVGSAGGIEKMPTVQNTCPHSPTVMWQGESVEWHDGFYPRKGSPVIDANGNLTDGKWLNTCTVPIKASCSPGKIIIAESASCQSQGTYTGGKDLRLLTYDEVRNIHGGIFNNLIGDNGTAADCGIYDETAAGVSLFNPLVPSSNVNSHDSTYGGTSLDITCGAEGTTNTPATPTSLAANPSGIYIATTGQYIRYEIPTFLGGYGFLAGKTITIELASIIATPTSGKKYVADFGTYKVYKKTDGIFYQQNCPPSGGTCSPETQLAGVSGSAVSISFVIPGTPTQFVIGNLYLPGNPAHLQGPVGSTVQRILIENT